MAGFLAFVPQILGKLLGDGSKGAADERTNQNNFQLSRNNQELARYNTSQDALLSKLLGQSNEATSRYNTQQGATTNAMQGMQSAVSHAQDAQSAEGLNRAQLGLQAPTVRAKQSILGSLMKNLQPTSIQSAPGQAGHETKLSGGMNASALDPTTRAQGEALMQQALQAQLTGSDVPEASNFMSGVQNWGSSVLTPPPATDYSHALLAPPELGGYKEPGKLETGLSMGSIIGNLLGELLPLVGSRSRGTGDPGMGAG